MSKFDEIIAQGRRLLSISDYTDADREFKRWDVEVGEWLSEHFPDSGLSAKWSSLGSSNLVWGNSIASSQDEWIEFKKIVELRLLWLSDLPEGGGKRSCSSTTISTLELPAKITLAWLWKHAPVKFWTWCCIATVAIFLFGVSFGQISWVRELYGDKSNRSRPNYEIGTISKPVKVTLSNSEIDLPGQGFFLVDTEGGSSVGNLKRINGLKEGDQVIIAADSNERTIIVKKSSYLKMPMDFYLNNEDDRIVFVCDGMNKCSEISRSSND